MSGGNAYETIQINRRPAITQSIRFSNTRITDLVDKLISDYTLDGYPYLSDDYGYVALVEPDDIDRVLTEIWDDWTLLDIPWEGITKRGDCFIAIFLANDDFGICFVIPDAEWVTGRLCRMVEANLDP